MVPLTLYGTTYALPETQSFNMLFYRKDVFAELGIDIPKDILTVDEMVGAICRLKSNI